MRKRRSLQTFDFGFLGFEFRRVRSLRGVWRPQYTPQTKKRSALLRKLKEIFRRYRSQPVGRVVENINPILRGWVNYFAIGHASRCFGYVRDWVEKKIRRHMMRAKNRRGYGWKRWSREWLYERLGLYGAYRVQRPWVWRDNQDENSATIKMRMPRRLTAL